MISEKELLNLTFETLLAWATDEAELNDEGEAGIEYRYGEVVETYLEELERTLNGEYK